MQASERVLALASDLSQVQLGLDEKHYREIAGRTTNIIRVGPRIFTTASCLTVYPAFSPAACSPLDYSFEPHIRGTANLKQLALSSPHAEPAKFFFTSSLSSVLRWPGPRLAPEAVTDDPAVAKDMGYAQSKWVSEKLSEIAAQKTPLRPTVLRIGQISLVIKFADTIGVLPDHDKLISWLPVDYAAKSIVEIMHLPTSQTECPVYHIHQHYITWSSVLTALEAAQLRFRQVSRQEWVKVLRASDPDVKRNPGRKLLTFFEGKYGGEKVKKGISVGAAVDKAQSVSRWIREMPVVDEVLVGKWAGAWRELGSYDRCEALLTVLSC